MQIHVFYLNQSFVHASPLKAYIISIYNVDISCLSETYLDSSIVSDNGNIEMLGYGAIGVDQ